MDAGRVSCADLSGRNDPPTAPSSKAKRRRRYIGVHFECCGVYARIYRQPNGMCYFGRCPRCLRAVMVRVGPHGTSARLFRAR